MFKTPTLVMAALITGPLSTSGLAQDRATTTTTDDIVARPAAFLGQHVRVRASVEDVYSASWFSVDDDSEWSTGRDLLIVNPAAVDRPDDGSDVIITGRVMTFTEVDTRRQSDSDLDLAPELVVQFTRRPVIVAESIVTDDDDELVRQSNDGRDNSWARNTAAESVDTGDIEDDIEDHVGRVVRTESEIDQLYSRSIFTIDDDVVVVAEGLNQSIAGDMDVSVTGTVIRFDRDAIERELPGYSVDLLPEAERELIGRPVIIARSVETEAGVELMDPAPTTPR